MQTFEVLQDGLDVLHTGPGLLRPGPELHTGSCAGVLTVLDIVLLALLDIVLLAVLGPDY